MKAMYAMVAMLVTVSGCGQTHGNRPNTGSQTHFLSACTSSCPSPYECLCGLCSLACQTDRVCAAEAQGALCAQPSTMGTGTCDETQSLCDVTCGQDAECETIAAYLGCVDGRCRQTAPASQATDGGGGAVGPPIDAGVVVSAADAAARGLSPAICNGSDEVRLRVIVEGGFVWSAYKFTNPYGLKFIVVDGKCRYYASSDFMAGIVTGTLSAAEADQLETDIRWAQLDALSFADLACPDSGSTTITKPGARAYCSCGCDDDAPSGLAEAIAGAGTWLDALPKRGTPLTSAVKAVAFAVQFESTADFSTAWPLAQNMADIDGLIAPEGGDVVGAGFDDADESAKLRLLRADALAAKANQQADPFIGVHDDRDVQYQLYVADQLPADVVEGVAALLSSVPQSP